MRQFSKKFLNLLSFTCEFGQKSRFSHWRKSNHSNSSVSWLWYFKTLSDWTSFFASCWLNKLSFEFGEFSFEKPKMVGSCLVFLGPFHLCFNFCYFLRSGHSLVKLNIKISILFLSLTTHSLHKTVWSLLCLQSFCLFLIFFWMVAILALSSCLFKVIFVHFSCAIIRFEFILALFIVRKGVVLSLAVKLFWSVYLFVLRTFIVFFKGFKVDHMTIVILFKSENFERRLLRFLIATDDITKSLD